MTVTTSSIILFSTLLVLQRVFLCRAVFNIKEECTELSGIVPDSAGRLEGPVNLGKTEGLSQLHIRQRALIEKVMSGKEVIIAKAGKPVAKIVRYDPSKEALGKLQVPRNFREVLGGQSFEMLDITAHHAHAVGGLCDHHRDPFDRMLVAQAKIEGLSLVTRDRHLKRYDIAIVEA